MLSLYGSFKVPGVDHVTLYRDDEDPHTFYMLPERPTIALDDEGDPLFSFILYARDLERLAPDAREVQRAYLSLSTQVATTPDDEKKIRRHLSRKLNGELSRGYRFLRLPILRREPVLSYPPVFTSGSVSFKTFNDELVPFSAGSSEPSLIGANLASFSQMLNQDGSELFRQSVEKGIVPSLIEYQLSFLARIPAISIHIHGNRRDFYEELKTHTIVTKIRKRNGRVVFKKTWPEIGSLKEFRNTFHSLKVEVDDGDFREADPADDRTAELEKMAFAILQDNILPSFFETAFDPATEGQSKNKWLKDIEKHLDGQIDVHMKRTDIVELHKNPNSQLGNVLSPEAIEKQTLYVDLSNPFFEEMDVTVNANVNFDDDPVFALKVFLDYDQEDEVRGVRVKHTKEMLFKEASQVERFRFITAKGPDGAPKDTYSYWSELIYKETGESIRIPARGSLESRERQLVISYRRLGFVKVTLIWGSMPDSVRSASVKIRYPHSDLPSAHQVFELSHETPTATFFTYTGQTGEPDPYRYKVTYRLENGQQMESKELEGRAETLTITDPFEQTLETRFLAQADFGDAQTIIVDATYTDGANDFVANHHAELQSNGETSLWRVSLPDPKRRDFEYNAIVVNRDGSRDEIKHQRGRMGETIAVPAAATGVLEVTIVSSLIDWTKYELVLLMLKVSDPASGTDESESFAIRPADGDSDRTWKVLLNDSQRKSYRYRLRYFGENHADNRTTEWQTTEDEILVLQDPTE